MVDHDIDHGIGAGVNAKRSSKRMLITAVDILAGSNILRISIAAEVEPRQP